MAALHLIYLRAHFVTSISSHLLQTAIFLGLLIVNCESDSDATDKEFWASDRGAIWAGYFLGNYTPAKSLYEKLKANMKTLIESRAVTLHEHVGFLAPMLLDGLQRIESAYAHRSVSDSAMREMLLKGGDDFRAQAVWYLQQWVKGTDERSQAWAHLLPEFLKEVWPRHKDGKSPRTSARLCDLALSDPQLFPRVAGIITDLVAKISDQHLILTNLQDEGSVIMKQHPSRCLRCYQRSSPRTYRNGLMVLRAF